VVYSQRRDWREFCRLKKLINKTTPADRLLLLLLLAVSVSGIFVARQAMPASSDVVVEIDGRPVFSAPLSEDRLITLQSSCGPIEVEIRSSRVRIKDAHCPNKLCMKEGWVSKGIIVCLPGKVVVFAGTRGTARKKNLDAVTG
jgi:hypothetical protein